MENDEIRVYKQALDNARKELAEKEKEREKLDARITQLKQSIPGLAALCGSSHGKPAQPLGVTELVRASLENASGPITVSAIREAVVKGLRPNEAASKTLLIKIHTALQRARDAGGVIPLLGEGEKRTYVVNGKGNWTYEKLVEEAVRSSKEVSAKEVMKKFGITGKFPKARIKKALRKGVVAGLYREANVGRFVLASRRTPGT